ncbi:glucose 1-dehydrogenase [Bradyrhizobium sp. dw_411]|uniref:glucose 1-dehydrogenase n=1 Tax=Bradyrhizobium sp. dw_411 TaxID=2720082 RepID=UPI001BCAF391|nr:glucose 1-dehydrogenase [Bradyrhizobium sp. dw_411]
MRGLKDKVVVVTGGAGGMGKAICRRFIEEGARVAIFDLHGDEAVALAKELGEGRTHVEALDISDYAAVENAVERTETEFGAIDVLVNNAGWDRFQMFLDTDAKFRERVIAVNLEGPINMHHVVLKKMSQRKSGRVVTVASDAGRVGSSGQAVYSACKGGLIAFTKTMAREMLRYNVILNCVCPGPTDTPMLRAFQDEGERGKRVFDALKDAIPMRRLGQPEDIPGAVLFFASDDASFMTGQVLSVSGGLTMHG